MFCQGVVVHFFIIFSFFLQVFQFFMKKYFPKGVINMVFGMPSLACFRSIEENLAFANQLGLDFVELNMNLPFCTVQALQKENLPSLCQKYGVTLTLHADENLFFCDFNLLIAGAHLQTMLDTIVLCRESGIPLINFHMSEGVHFSLPDRKLYLFEEYESIYQKRLLAFREACHQAADNSVRLCIENTGLRMPLIFRAIDLLLQSPAFALTWDTGHDHSAGGTDAPFLLARKDRLIHMHLHDALGKKNHLALGTGEIDLKAVLNAASPQRVVIEVKAPDELTASVSYLKSHLL